MMSTTDQIYALLFELVPLTISLIGFIIGIVNILKKKAPYFFTLIIFAVGCYVIEQASLAVNTWCEIYDDVWVGALGAFASNLFILSANYGALDKVLDETKTSISIKMVSLITPAIVLMAAIGLFISWKDSNMMCAIVFPLILAPAIPASYFNVKHLLLPKDELGLLKAIKPCDVVSLALYFTEIVYLFVEAFAPVVYLVIAAIAMSLVMLGLALAAAKGVKSWGI